MHTYVYIRICIYLYIHAHTYTHTHTISVTGQQLDLMRMFCNLLPAQKTQGTHTQKCVHLCSHIADSPHTCIYTSDAYVSYPSCRAKDSNYTKRKIGVCVCAYSRQPSYMYMYMSDIYDCFLAISPRCLMRMFCIFLKAQKSQAIHKKKYMKQKKNVFSRDV